MNPLEQVNVSQNYIIAIKLHQDRSIITSKSETSQTGRISKLKSKNWAKILYAPCHFEPISGALPEVQTEIMIDRWKSMPIYFPTQVEFLDLDVIFPSKPSISQDWFLCVQKVAERPFLECF